MPDSDLRQSDGDWNERFEPWLGSSVTEEGIVYVGNPGEQERAHHGRVIRDGDWVHVQTDAERLSFPAAKVNAILWETRSGA